MTSKLKPSDLPERIDARPYILFEGLNDGYDPEDDFSIELSKAKIKHTALTIEKLAEKYDVDIEVAKRLHSYQNDLMGQFHEAVDEMLADEKRYLSIKPYINDPTYDNQTLEMFVRYDNSSKEYEKWFDPKIFLRTRLISLFVSYVLLAVAIIISVRNFDELGLDVLGSVILGVIWFLINFFVTISTPIGYRTRKLIYGLKYE